MGNACQNTREVNFFYENNILWIDKNLDNDKKKIADLEMKNSIKVEKCKNIEQAILSLTKISFKETKIVICGDLYSNFVGSFKKKIRKMCVAPKIIVFTDNEQNFLTNNPFYKNEENIFYTFGGIETKYDKIKDFITKEIKYKNDVLLNIDKSDNPRLTFEYIDQKEKLILPLFFKSLIDETNNDNIDEYTIRLYNTYSSKNNKIKKLLGSICLMKNIPIEILSKYYARLYTINSKFYSDMNENLEKNQTHNFIPFIKVLYEGVKLKSLPLSKKNELYRGSFISKEEIKIIEKYISEKKVGLPSSIVFSKSFLSFSKEKTKAMDFLNNADNNENLLKVLFILDNDKDGINYNLSTHSDIEDISIYPNEREVLFFPFSSFEIKSLKKGEENKEKVWEIKLSYLGKYLQDIEVDQFLISNENKIPESKFKEELMNSNLIQKNKIENIKTKELYEAFKEYENEVNKIIIEDEEDNDFEIMNRLQNGY